jgi:hypothetical protein
VNAMTLHQPRHAVLATGDAAGAQLSRHAGAAVRAATLAMDRTDLDQQSRVGGGAATHSPIAPGVVPGRRDIEDAAQRGDAVLVAMSLDEGVLHRDCLAKYAVAFLRMSRSSRT